MIASTLSLAVPFLLAGLGGLVAERSGVLNIGLEGLMLAGAFAAIAVAQTSGSVAAGFAAAMIVGIGFSVLFAEVVLRLQANPFVVGLALNLLVAGVVPVVSRVVFATAGVVRLRSAGPLGSLAGINLSVFAAVLITIAIGLWLSRSPGGLRLRAAGENERALAYRGVSPRRVRYLAMLACGALSAIGGAAISLRLGVYLPNITSGRGWIALVTVFLGLRRPAGVALSALFFAIFESIAANAQAILSLPATALLGLPHLLTVVAMVLYALLARLARLRRDRSAGE